MTRRFEFAPTKAVESARRRSRYIDCPECGSKSERYLFHRTGIRFVRCGACDLVYTNPADPGESPAFDNGALGMPGAVETEQAKRERISIIVPVYNEERYVREVIEALLAKD